MSDDDWQQLVPDGDARQGSFGVTTPAELVHADLHGLIDELDAWLDELDLGDAERESLRAAAHAKVRALLAPVIESQIERLQIAAAGAWPSH